MSGLLTLDLGNSRCKLRVWQANSIDWNCSARADFEGAQRLPERIAGWLRSVAPVDRTILSSVAGHELEDELMNVLREASTIPPQTPDHGLEILCRVPDRVGRDRLFAARGALDVVGEAAIVVDAGTAVTVDAVLFQGKDGPHVGSFLGGSIAPGPALWARALAEGAARLPLVAPRPDVAALGRDTEEAILGGIGVGFRGAVRELCEAIAREADLGPAPIVITGGARDYLLRGEPRLSPRRLVPVEDLVHRGLLAAGARST